MRDLDATASEGKAARFIMRAHQTYRVLLNAPIFKQMKVGDSKGQEPMGKSVAFAVVEEGKPTPYMIRVSSTILRRRSPGADDETADGR